MQNTQLPNYGGGGGEGSSVSDTARMPKGIVFSKGRNNRSMLQPPNIRIDSTSPEIPQKKKKSQLYMLMKPNQTSTPQQKGSKKQFNSSVIINSNIPQLISSKSIQSPSSSYGITHQGSLGKINKFSIVENSTLQMQSSLNSSAYNSGTQSRFSNKVSQMKGNTNSKQSTISNWESSEEISHNHNSSLNYKLPSVLSSSHHVSHTQSQYLLQTSSSSSKFSQGYLDLYSQNALLLDQSENKQYNFFESRNSKTDLANFNSIQQMQQSANSKTVKIKQSAEGSQSKLKGFISRTANRPNTFNADQEFDGRSLKMYADGGKKMFNFDNLFFSLYPEVDMTIKIKVSFGEVRETEAYLAYKKQKAIDESNAQAQHEQMLDKLHQNIPNQGPQLKFTSIKSRRKRDVLLNKFPIENIFDKYDRILKGKGEKKEKQFEVQERKNQLFLEKWSDVEEKNRVSTLRSQFQMEKRKLVERISKFHLYQMVWIKIINQVNVIHAIHSKFIFLKQQRKIYHKAKFIVIRAISGWVKTLRKFGPYPEKRSLTGVCIASNKLAQILSRKCNEQAEKAICSYLVQSSKISDLKSKIVNLISRVTKIQRQWREVKMKKKKFKELIVRQFQSKYNEYLNDIKNEIKKEKDAYFQFKNSQSNAPATAPAKVSDFVLLSQIINDYLKTHLRKYYEKYEQFRRTIKLKTMGLSDDVNKLLSQRVFKLYSLLILKNQAKKNHEISVAMQKPSFFRLPKDNELRQMVEEYAQTKQLLN